MSHNKMNLCDIIQLETITSRDVIGYNIEAGNTAIYKLQHNLRSFSIIHTIDQYRPKKKYGNPWKEGQYEVTLEDDIAKSLNDTDRLREIGKVYHPGNKK